MSARPSPSEAGRLESNRLAARVVLRVKAEGGASRIERLREGGGFRVKFPEPGGAGLDAVLVNIGGGIAGGDSVDVTLEAAPAARLRVTSQAAEKVYRSALSPAVLTMRARAEADARLTLAPQETILFDAAKLTREIVVESAPDATTLIADMTVFGRLASGERLASGALRDRWRIFRAGALIHAEDTRLEGALADSLDRPAIGAGARAMLTAVLVGPQAEAKLEAAQAALVREGVVAGSSAWDGKLVARALARDPAALRAAYAALLAALDDAPLPRCW